MSTRPNLTYFIISYEVTVNHRGKSKNHNDVIWKLCKAGFLLIMNVQVK